MNCIVLYTYFIGEIYEPIMMELNVLEESKSKYVETVVPLRDKLAFTCTNKEDMNMMIQTLRCNQKLKINVLHSCKQFTSLLSINYILSGFQRLRLVKFFNQSFLLRELGNMDFTRMSILFLPHRIPL